MGNVHGKHSTGRECQVPSRSGASLTLSSYRLQWSAQARAESPSPWVDRTSGCHTPWPGCRSSRQSASGPSCSLGFSANLVRGTHTKIRKSTRWGNRRSLGLGNPVVFQMGSRKKKPHSPVSVLAMTTHGHLLSLFFFFFQLYFSLSFNWIYYNTFFLMFYSFGHEACEISAPWQGIEPVPRCMGRQSLNHCTTGKPLFWIFNPLQNRSIIPFGINEKKQISSKLWQFSLLPFQLDWSFLIFRWY